ncbi:hypothetical protein Tco_0816360 [Tanacetum coccineum]
MPLIANLHWWPVGRVEGSVQVVDGIANLALWPCGVSGNGFGIGGKIGKRASSAIQLKPPSLEDIRNRIHLRVTFEKQTKQGIVHKLLDQIETNELLDHLKPCELVIWENAYVAIENSDYVQGSIALMLYCIEVGRPYNLAYFVVRQMDCFRDRIDKVLLYGMILTRFFKNFKEIMANHPFDDRYILIPRIMSSLKAKQPKNPRNVRKSKQAQLPSSSSSESAPSDNGDLPSTKLSPRSYHRALPARENMSDEQRETRGMFKNMARALHTMGRMLKRGCH